MDGERTREQEESECFGIPSHVHAEADGSAAPLPPGRGRRDWVLHESWLLGPEALPSPPMPAAIELDIVG
jgi:hypothetical protein